MQLRDDQQAMVDAATAELQSGKRSLLLVAPTGWGKTVTVLAIINTIMRLAGDGKRVLWCAHRDRLLRQAFDAAHAIAPALLSNLLLLNSASRRFCAAHVLVVDEAHRDATRTNQRIRREANPQIVLGATATPDRHDRSGLNFEAVLSAPSADRLIDAGILSQYDHFSLDAPARSEHLVTAVLSDPIRWGKSLIFVATTDEAHRAATRLRAGGVRAAVALGDEMQAAAVAAFTGGRIDVLITCHALSEGVDLPSLQSVFMRDSLPTSTLQAVGRALRRFGPKVANVIQFVSAKAPFFDVVTPRRRWLGAPAGSWRELSTKPLWPALAESTKTLIAQRLSPSSDERPP